MKSSAVILWHEFIQAESFWGRNECDMALLVRVLLYKKNAYLENS